MPLALDLPFTTTAPDLWGGLLAAVLVVLGFHWLARRRDARLASDVAGLVATLKETGKVSWGHLETAQAFVRASEQGLRGSLEEVSARAHNLERGQQQAGQALAELEGRLAEAAGRVPALSSALAELRQRTDAAERARVTDLQGVAARALSAERRAEAAEQAGARLSDRTGQLEQAVGRFSQQAREAEERARALAEALERATQRAEALDGRTRELEASLQVLLASASEKDSTLKAEIARLAERLERAASAPSAPRPPAPPALLAPAPTPEPRGEARVEQRVEPVVAPALAPPLPPPARLAAPTPAQPLPHGPAHGHGQGHSTPSGDDSDTGGLLALALLLLLVAAGLLLGSFVH